MSPIRFHVHTFGCRANQADGDALADQLRAAGATWVDELALADVLVVNSCTVTHRSDRDVRKLVHRLHRDHPAARIVVTGCYPSRAPDAFGPADGVQAVVGNDRRDDLAAILGFFTTAGAALPLAPQAERAALEIAVARHGHTRPMVKVQDGCDACCAFCIVPHVRGPSRSVPPERVRERVRQLARDGAREIILTGIHLGDYGRKFEPPFLLWQLVETLLAETGLARVRLSSIEPLEVDEGLVDLAGREPRLAPHFHIPLQSGSAAVLRRMGRPYTPAAYARLVRRLERVRPGLAIGADIMTGFPGEGETEFRETVDFIAGLPFTYLHVFPFSPRPGTPAAGMPDRPGAGLAHRRGEFLRRMGQEKNLAYKRSLLGHPLPGLTLGREKGAPAAQIITENYINVTLANAVVPPNTPVIVVISRVAASGACYGELSPPTTDR